MNSELYWRMLLFLLTYIHVGKWMTTVGFYNQFRLIPVMFSNKFNFDNERLFLSRDFHLAQWKCDAGHNIVLVTSCWVTVLPLPMIFRISYSPHMFQIIADTERAIWLRVGVTLPLHWLRPISTVCSILP